MIVWRILSGAPEPSGTRRGPAMTLVASEEGAGKGQRLLAGLRKRHVSLGSGDRGKEEGDGGYPPRAPRASAAACHRANQGKALGRWSAIRRAETWTRAPSLKSRSRSVPI